MTFDPYNPSLPTWLDVEASSEFPIQNIPFGIFQTDYLTPGACTIIGDCIIDLTYLHENGFLDGLGLPAGVFNQSVLNDFIGLGKKVTSAVRLRLMELFHADNEELRDNKAARTLALIPKAEVTMCMPLRVGNYTDFYSSIEHATNVGTMFRDPDNALLPNWRHMPVGYHGRASSIVIGGTNIHRPNGQTKTPDQALPEFGPTKRLDFELEMAFVTNTNLPLGESVSTARAEDHIFGLMLFNDWSARDIQVWEYVPLGPFLAKSFASTVSPWVVTLEALAPCRVAGPDQTPEVLPYLAFKGKKNYDIQLEVAIQPEGSEETRIAQSNFKHMYWNMAQQLAHQTINGCNIQVGDLYASGTISGPTPDSFGSMLELAWKGTKPLAMKNGSTRSFIHDGDEVILRGHGSYEGIKIGFGEVRTKILPAL